MTHHEDHKNGKDDNRDEVSEGQVPGPTDDSDAATEADAGLPGTPAVSYTPGGMDDPPGAENGEGVDDEGDSDT